MKFFLLNTLELLCVSFFCATVIVALVPSYSTQAKSPFVDHDEGCLSWWSLIDKTLDKPTVQVQVDTSKEDVIMEGIECLLRLEGNQNPARFGGAMNDGVSKMFIFHGEMNDGSKIVIDTKTEVAALYYVSYLFKSKFDHANAVALKDSQTGDVDSPKIVKKAFKAYREWFEKIKELGLEEARKQNLDPLKGTGVRWY